MDNKRISFQANQPAFARPPFDNDNKMSPGFEGLTKREYAAIAFAAAMMGSYQNSFPSNDAMEFITEKARLMADILITDLNT